MSIGERAIGLHLQPGVAVRQRETFHHCRSAGVVLLRDIVLEEITHVVGIVQVGESIDVPVTCAVDRGIEHEGTIDIPVAVDVLGPGDASTSLLVVSHHIADVVASRAEVDERHDRTLVTLDIGVVEKLETVGERRFQSGVTLSDVHRVAVVPDIEQVGDIRLLSRSTILDAQVAQLVEAVTEVERRRHIGHVSDDIGVYTLIILDIM